MNKILKITFVLFLSLTYFACSHDESVKLNGNQLSNSIEALKTNGVISSAKIAGNIVFITYKDGIKMSFNVSNQTEIIAFDDSNNKLIAVNFIENNNSYDLNDIQSFNNKNTYAMNPEHPGQDFCDCYKQDVDEFCDGVVGCVALLHPLVQAVLVAHCVYETGTTTCNN